MGMRAVEPSISGSIGAGESVGVGAGDAGGITCGGGATIGGGVGRIGYGVGGIVA